MPTPFLDDAWIDSLFAALRTDDAVRQSGAEWVHGPVRWVVEADSDKGFAAPQACRIDLHEGSVRDVRACGAVQSGADQAPFEVRGSFAHWKALLTGSGTHLSGLTDGRFHLTGDLTTMARYDGLWTAVLAVARGLETAWQDEQPADAQPQPAGAAN